MTSLQPVQSREVHRLPFPEPLRGSPPPKQSLFSCPCGLATCFLFAAGGILVHQSASRPSCPRQRQRRNLLPLSHSVKPSHRAGKQGRGRRELWPLPPALPQRPPPCLSGVLLGQLPTLVPSFSYQLQWLHPTCQRSFALV